MPSHELTPLGRSILDPNKPLRWIRNSDYTYNLHQFEPQQNGTYHQHALAVNTKNPFSEGLFKHVPTVDDYGLTHDTAAPDLKHGDRVNPEQQNHWQQIYDKINTEATRGSLDAEKFARMYNEALKK